MLYICRFGCVEVKKCMLRMVRKRFLMESLIINLLKLNNMYRMAYIKVKSNINSHVRIRYINSVFFFFERGM